MEAVILNQKSNQVSIACMQVKIITMQLSKRCYTALAAFFSGFTTLYTSLLLRDGFHVYNNT